MRPKEENVVATIDSFIDSILAVSDLTAEELWRIASRQVARRANAAAEQTSALLKKQGLELRQEGKILKTIAADLHEPMWKIIRVSAELLRDGVSIPMKTGKERKRYKSRYSGLRREELEEKIIALRAGPMHNKKIAQELGISSGTLQQEFIRYLIKEGRLPKRPPFGGKQERKPIDLTTERNQKIIAMSKDLRTLDEMGTVFGITRERVRQIRMRIICDHGEAVLAPGEEFLTVPEAVKQIGANPSIVRRACCQANIPVRKRGKGNRILIDAHDIEKLKEAIFEERVCIICKTPFTAYRARPACACTSPACRKERAKQRMKYMRQKPADQRAKDISPWHRELMERLAEHTIPENEAWLGSALAIKRSGVSYMQFSWLRIKKIIHPRPHPTRRWAIDSSRPVMLYSASEIDIVREVYEKHGSPRGKPKQKMIPADS